MAEKGKIPYLTFGQPQKTEPDPKRKGTTELKEPDIASIPRPEGALEPDPNRPEMRALKPDFPDPWGLGKMQHGASRDEVMNAIHKSISESEGKDKTGKEGDKEKPDVDPEKEAKNRDAVNLIQKKFLEKGPEGLAEAAMDVLNQQIKDDKMYSDTVNDLTKKLEREQDQAINQASQKIQEENDLAARALKKTNETMDKISERIAQGYDPQNFWNDRSNFAKVMGVLAIAGGQFAAVLTDTDNNALEIIKDAVERDIQAQQDHLTYLKDAGQLTADKYKRLVDASQNRKQDVLNEKVSRLASLSTVASQMIKNKVNERNWGASVKQTLMGVNEEIYKANHQVVGLDRQKDLLDIQAKRQKLMFDWQQQSMPAGHVKLPGLSPNEQVTFEGSPQAKQKAQEALTEGRTGIKEADSALNAVQTMENWMKFNKMEGFGSFWGLPSKEWQENVGAAHNQFSTMIQRMHNILDKGRMTNEDRALAKELLGVDSLKNWRSLSYAQLTKKLHKIKNMAKRMAVSYADQIVNSFATYARQGPQILKAWNKEFVKDKTGKFSEDQTKNFNRVFKYFDIIRASHGKQADIGTIVRQPEETPKKPKPFVPPITRGGGGRML